MSGRPATIGRSGRVRKHPTATSHTDATGHRNEHDGYITAHRRIATPPSTAFTTHWRT
jgi:hypothetical protein